ncbi:MAG: DNA polymerase III subunit gamma/tau [Planctomycetes bacterium]|nr:DNA polymerase III subunit gamma/tau [Planctomycetota bacterium]
MLVTVRPQETDIAARENVAFHPDDGVVRLRNAAGNDVDVLEIDGASNRGIDDIRSLRSNVNVMSMRTKFKIYIIDEVHMLTKEAFNALLKTLEEPPPTVKFVFCTTEPNKVPDTILSRCQRFDFSTIETASIIGRLQQIAEAEGFEVDPSAMELVARRAAGSMRDSQSLFDQLLAFGGEHITADDVHKLFGTADDDQLIQLLDALRTQQRDVALKLFDQMLSGGVQLGELMDQLLYCLRDLMILASGADGVGLLGVSEGNRAALTDQANSWGLQKIVAALEILTEARSRMFRASYGRTIAETAMIRISLLDDLDRLGDLIHDLKQGSLLNSDSKSTSSSPRSDSPQSSVSKPDASHGTNVPNNPNQQAEKKTPDSEKESRDSQRRLENQAASVPFQSGCEDELWSQVLSNVNDASSTHLRNASIAISGPNRLEISFPTSYHFSKQYCERPEMLGRLERLVAEITGQPVSITMTLSEPAQIEQSQQSESTDLVSGEAGGAGSDPRKTTAEIATQSVGSQNDPFVKQAEEVFGGTTIKVEEISSSLPQSE